VAQAAEMENARKEHVAQNRTGGKCDVSFNLYARNAM